MRPSLVLCCWAASRTAAAAGWATYILADVFYFHPMGAIASNASLISGFGLVSITVFLYFVDVLAKKTVGRLEVE